MWVFYKTPANRTISASLRRPEASIEAQIGRCYARPSFRADKERRNRVERPIELTAEGVWNEISGRLREALNENTFSTWFSEVGARSITDDELVLTVPNNFTREWIEGHFLGLIGAAIAEIDSERSIRLEVAKPQPRTAGAESSPPGQTPTTLGINTKYTFDSFVIGSSNRFAHAAALAVAEAPAQAYNPLFIYGGTGLGKTHLLQAISQYVGEHPGNLSVRYVTSETFMNDFINSLRDKRIEGFKQRYRTYDLLLVDDVQFFEHKERIQEEFFHTFNSLYELCGDRRSQNIGYPRQVAMYLSRELTDSSLPKIGKQFGGRDHTTVIHATSKIARMIREDRSVYNLVQELTARIKQVR